MDQHGVERHLTGLLDGGKDHARHREEDDIIARYQRVGRVEVFQVLGILRPAECGERPQRGREPGVERVGVLVQVMAAAFGAGIGLFLHNDHFAAVCAVPRGNAVTPPQLA